MHYDTQGKSEGVARKGKLKYASWGREIRHFIAINPKFLKYNPKSIICDLKFLTLSLLIFLCLSESAFPQIVKALKEKKGGHKNDVVVMINGDRNTGEIKKMEFGVLYLKSDFAADTLKLDWKRVARVQSSARYEFETVKKDFYFGVIAENFDQGTLTPELKIVLDDESLVPLNISDVIRIREMGRSILSRINLSLDAGISFTSANDRTQSNIALSASLQKPKYSGRIQASSQFSGEPGTTNTARHEIQILADRFLKKHWEIVFLGGLLHDNQQELDLRTTAGGGVQRTFFESNRTIFSAMGGLVYTNENYANDADRKNAEVVSGLRFSTYRFRGSEFDLGVFIFPSLSDPGRIRIDSDFDWKWDIVKDLYWKVSFIDNYDSDPPPNGINNNLSVTSSVGWNF